MKNILIVLINFLLLSFTCAEGLVVSYRQFDIKVEIKAREYADAISSGNEYKLSMTLVRKEKYDTSMVGVLKGSTSENIYRPLTDNVGLQLGESETFHASVKLPETTANHLNLSVNILEDDFTIPIPGPCCMGANNDDMELRQKLPLAFSQTIKKIKGPSADITITITPSEPKEAPLYEIIESFHDSFFPDSYFGLRSRRSLLDTVLKTI
jgi:hypothetical protein